MLRRTKMGFTPDQGLQALPTLIEMMSKQLDWNAHRCWAEESAYLEQIALTQAFREKAKEPSPEPNLEEGSLQIIEPTYAQQV